jgi:hypothetical protein
MSNYVVLHDYAILLHCRQTIKKHVMQTSHQVSHKASDKYQACINIQPIWIFFQNTKIKDHDKE